ncbi:ATP-binding cassette domain-containing protein [Heliobacillus mobilis]|uniref:ATP-binding cassette domain-containing protein n=1 Tax=Heliobacterium mobile TaxID=28064 RepID=A0A6I3SQB8_HELMO|nr:ATP-binding cassette domain-containing protein [Heliobacterium mobile]MTV50612.1 ATP-binding cassette domain-containing protein [Heliobacterium mobile]
MNKTVLEFKKVTIGHPNIPVLRDISLEIKAGSLTGIYLPDGDARWMFFQVAAGLMLPLSGEVLSLVQPIGLVPERFFLYPDLTVEENIQLVAELYTVPEALRAERIDRSIEACYLSEYRKQRAGLLSFTEKMFLQLAASLVTESELILLDEATREMASKDKERFWKVIEGEHAAEGAFLKGIIFLSHNKEEICRCTTQIDLGKRLKEVSPCS